MKINNLGEKIWVRQWGGTGTEYGLAAEMPKKAGSKYWYIVGQTTSWGTGGGYYDGFFAKFDDIGDLVYAKVYGNGGGNDIFLDIAVFDGDTRAAACGYTETDTYAGNGNDDFWYVKFDPATGTIISGVNIGDSSNDVGYACEFSADGYILFFAGYTSSGNLRNSGSWDGLLFSIFHDTPSLVKGTSWGAGSPDVIFGMDVD